MRKVLPDLSSFNPTVLTQYPRATRAQNSRPAGGLARIKYVAIRQAPRTKRPINSCKSLAIWPGTWTTSRMHNDCTPRPYGSRRVCTEVGSRVPPDVAGVVHRHPVDATQTQSLGQRGGTEVLFIAGRAWGGIRIASAPTAASTPSTMSTTVIWCRRRSARNNRSVSSRAGRIRSIFSAWDEPAFFIGHPRDRGRIASCNAVGSANCARVHDLLPLGQELRGFLVVARGLCRLQFRQQWPKALLGLIQPQ